MNAIVYLSRSREAECRQTIHSIRLLAENILPWSSADIFVFHENGYDRSIVESDPVAGKLVKRFIEVDFSSIPHGTEELPSGQRGYRHMCHFFANDIFFQPELQGYDYQMRLDVDSYILSPVPFDIFELMRDRGIRYTYRMEMREKAAVSRGLLECCEQFFRENPEFDKRGRPLEAVKLFYTNFEICDLKWFRGPSWQAYFKAIDDAGGIYRHRWGDAPIRWLGLKHMLDGKEIHCLRQMAYFHAFKLEKNLTFRMPGEYLRYALSVIFSTMKRRREARAALAPFLE